MTTALVLGKFLPPHAGHVFLAERARELADEVIVLVLAHPDEPIPVDLRHRWLEELLPWATVRSCVADHPVDYEDDAVYDLWAATIRECIGRPTVDLLVTSEPAYGDRTAAAAGRAARARRSGSARRADLRDRDPRGSLGELALLRAGCAGVVRAARLPAWAPSRPARRPWPRPWLASTTPSGCRSTAAPTPCRRTRPASRGRPTTSSVIARRQQADEDEAARLANRILFCDTDALTTAIWHERYLGRPSPEVETIAAAGHYDLTFLMGTDVPWIKDKIRNSREVREQMQQRFREVLRDRPEPVLELRGTLDERTATAVEAIDHHLGLRPPA